MVIVLSSEAKNRNETQNTSFCLVPVSVGSPHLAFMEHICMDCISLASSLLLLEGVGMWVHISPWFVQSGW